MMRPSEISTRTDLKLETFWRVQRSQPIREMLKTASYFALSDLGIRIVGEKGSGKLHLARLIHQYSSRGSFSFTHIDCSDLVSDGSGAMLFGAEDRNGNSGQVASGLLESGDQGTIYLDVVDALPATAKTRLMHALELRRFRRIGGNQDIHMNARIITGHTQSNGSRYGKPGISTETATRVNPVCINIPPLRERREDIEPLIYLFLKDYSEEFNDSVTHITPKALEILQIYSWPDNIYELRNVIRHAALRCKSHTLDLIHVPEYIRHENEILDARFRR